MKIIYFPLYAMANAHAMRSMHLNNIYIYCTRYIIILSLVS